jgi:hypothetical protein
MKTLKKIGIWLMLLHVIPLITVVALLIGGYSFFDGYLAGMLGNVYIMLTIGLCRFIVWLLVNLEII